MSTTTPPCTPTHPHQPCRPHAHRAWRPTASPRYRFEPVGEGVRLLVAKRSRLWPAFAKVELVSEAGAVLRFIDAEYASALRKMKVAAGDAVSLQFLESGRFVDGSVVEVDTESEPPIIEVRFGELVPLVDLSSATPAPMVPIRFVVSAADPGEVTTDQLGRRLHLMFELVDEVRTIANGAMSTATTAVYSPPTVVRRLSVASPIDVILEMSALVATAVPWAVISQALWLAAKIPEKRKTWFEGTSAKVDVQAKKLDIATKQLVLAETQARTDRDVAVVELATVLAEALRVAAGEGADVPSPERMRERLQPILDRMVDAGVERIDTPAVHEGTSE